MLRIKIGCQLGYATASANPAVFILAPRTNLRQRVEHEKLRLHGVSATVEYTDAFGNRCQRVTLAPGASLLHYEAIAHLSPDPDPMRPEARQVPPERLPAALLRYTLPSRYAENDKLLSFAWQNFAHLRPGFERASGICAWVHDNVEYRRGISLPQWSAADVIARRQGVCRDRAHAVIALCRAFNMPARYAVSYLPDIDVPDDGTQMDFHAYAEVWLEGGWQVFDPHDLRPRKGRVFIAAGLDAADTAFATLYGDARMTELAVWADPVDERGRKLDLSRRIRPAATIPPSAPSHPPAYAVPAPALAGLG